MWTHRETREAGFSLVELLVALIIVSILFAAAFLAMSSVKASGRNDAMKTAAANIDQAIGSFNRMYPPVPAPADPLVQRGGTGTAWTGNTGNPNNGLADETGEWILNTWPKNPFGTGGVTVRRYAAPASCSPTAAGRRPGEVRICRNSANGRQFYQVVAWGKNRQNQPELVYQASHGGT